MKTKYLSGLLAVVLGLSTFNEEISSLSVRASETKTYVAVDYTVANENWALTTYDTKGFFQENGQLTLVSGEYDATANGAWLTYKVEAESGKKINELKLACVGNRLGSFGKAAGASGNTVSFKPYLSTTSTFDNPLEEVILPESTECYNLDYDFTPYLVENTSTYYVKLWFGSSAAGQGFYYDWFQLGTVQLTGSESKITYHETYVDANYTIANENWALTTYDTKGFFQENGQLILTTGEYDATANGAWLTYKIDAKEGATIDELKLACVGNRLGSFGKAAGASGNTVSFKPYLSTTSTFDNPLEEVILPESTECYNLDYDFTPYLVENTSTYYVKLWFGSSAAGQGFYYDWFQLGTVLITGKESGSKEQGPTTIDASEATITIENNTFTETGSEIRPIPTVTLNEVVLQDTVDYFVTYENNLEPGNATIHITYIGEYTGKSSLSFTITALPIEYQDQGYAIHKYVPNQYDFVDYWSGIGDIDPEYGDGITTFAHVSSLVPLKGTNIGLTSSVLLLSKLQDEVDGWVTYSFSAQPGVDGQDKTYPYYGGTTSGYFLHITNYSTTENPNTVEVQFVKSINGETTLVDKFMVDNLVTNTGVLANEEIIFQFNFVKNDDNTWTLKIVNKGTNEEIVSRNYNYLNERLFINEKGQTYFSTAIYEGSGCDGNHWEHRGLKIYDMDAFTLDSSNAKITLSQNEFILEEEGKPCKPTVNVTLNDVSLVKDVDYYFEYKNNKTVGTANVIVYFIGQYAGNETKTVNFTITAKNNEQPSDNPSLEPSEEPSDQPSETPSNSNGENPTKKGCKGSASSSIGFIALLGLLFMKKRKHE